MGITAAIIGGVVAAGTSAGVAVYQSNQAKESRQKAEQVAAQQQAEQRKLLNEAKDKENQQAVLERDAETQAAARAVQKRRAGLAGGRQGTILTGPLGIPNQAGGAAAPQGKTLLGL